MNNYKRTTGINLDDPGKVRMYGHPDEEMSFTTPPIVWVTFPLF